MPVVVSGFAALGESLILDPVEVATDRVELDLHDGPLMVRPEGPDWGDAEIAAYMAEGERGELPVDFRLPNRKVTIPLSAGLQGVSFNEAREELQAKVARIQQEGGWLKREFADGRKVYLDVVNATLGMGGGSLQAKLELDPDIDLVLETLPDWYGDEIELDQESEITLPHLVTVLKLSAADAMIEGDYPARCRIVVDDLQGQDQLGLLLGLRSRHYSAAATAELAYGADELTPLDSATYDAGLGAIKHLNLGTSWTPVVGTNVSGSYLTHTGSYRVWARVNSPDGTAVKVRFVYDTGDLVLPEENAAWEIPGISGIYLADLGQIRLDRVPVGTHRWQGQIQAKGTVGGEDVYVGQVYFQPVDDGACRLAVSSSLVEGLSSVSARDEFDQTAGALAGKTAPIGGTWAGAGDTDDFQVETTGKTAQRATTSDTTWRVDVPGAGTLTDAAVQADVKCSSGAAAAHLGVAARYTDINNFLEAHVEVLGTATAATAKLWLRKVVAGSVTQLADINIGTFTLSAWYTVRLVVLATGHAHVWIYPVGSVPGDPTLSAYDSVLATGGTLATGNRGLYDRNLTANAATRNYDNFLATPVTRGAVIFANQSVELRTDGVFREDSTGASSGPVVPIGDLLRIPPSGLEDRPVELFVKASRGDLGQLPDVGIDDIRAQVFYRPSWLFVPASVPGS